MLLSEMLDGPPEGAKSAGDASDEMRPVAYVGVGTGRVFCGTVGTLERREFTTMGDAVNTAARLMQQAGVHTGDDGEASRVLCDEATMSHTRATIHYKPLPRVRLKGKAGEMALYAPLAEVHDETADATSLISRMGRDTEFHLLRGMVSNLLVYHGGGGTIMLVGTQARARRRRRHPARRARRALGRPPP